MIQFYRYRYIFRLAYFLGKNNSQRTHQALPYVVASSNSNDSADKEVAASTNSPETAGNSKETEKKETPSSQADEQVRKTFYLL